jgi:hypothetical protein
MIALFLCFNSLKAALLFKFGQRENTRRSRPQAEQEDEHPRYRPVGVLVFEKVTTAAKTAYSVRKRPTYGPVRTEKGKNPVYGAGLPRFSEPQPTVSAHDIKGKSATAKRGKRMEDSSNIRSFRAFNASFSRTRLAFDDFYHRLPRPSAVELAQKHPLPSAQEQLTSSTKMVKEFPTGSTLVGCSVPS